MIVAMSWGCAKPSVNETTLALFGAVYRAVMRHDDNTPLRHGIIGAFALLRTFASLPVSREWSPELSAQLFSTGMEGAIVFGAACSAIEYAWDTGLGRPLEGSCRDFGYPRPFYTVDNYNQNGYGGDGYNQGYSDGHAQWWPANEISEDSLGVGGSFNFVWREDPAPERRRGGGRGRGR